MPDGDRLVRRQVDRCLHGQEAVDLTLGSELRVEVVDVHGLCFGFAAEVHIVRHEFFSFKIIVSFNQVLFRSSELD